MFHDVGRGVIGHVLAVDGDNVGQGLWVVLQSGSQQVGEACFTTARGARQEQAPRARGAQLLKNCSACANSSGLHVFMLCLPLVTFPSHRYPANLHVYIQKSIATARPPKWL